VRAHYHKAEISEQALRCKFVINLTPTACRISRHESYNSTAFERQSCAIYPNKHMTYNPLPFRSSYIAHWSSKQLGYELLVSPQQLYRSVHQEWSMIAARM